MLSKYVVNLLSYLTLKRGIWEIMYTLSVSYCYLMHLLN